MRGGRSGRVSGFQVQAPTQGGLRWGPQTPLVYLHPSPAKDSVMFCVPRGGILHRFWAPGAWSSEIEEWGPRGETAMARVRLRSRDVFRPEATPLP